MERKDPNAQPPRLPLVELRALLADAFYRCPEEVIRDVWAKMQPHVDQQYLAEGVALLDGGAA